MDLIVSLDSAELNLLVRHVLATLVGKTEANSRAFPKCFIILEADGDCEKPNVPFLFFFYFLNLVCFR